MSRSSSEGQGHNATCLWEGLYLSNNVCEYEVNRLTNNAGCSPAHSSFIYIYKRKFSANIRLKTTQVFLISHCVWLFYNKYLLVESTNSWIHDDTTSTITWTPSTLDSVISCKQKHTSGFQNMYHACQNLGKTRNISRVWYIRKQ